jgi:phosphopantothenoylcysteine decarboxylase/phosphopantothenate--cysteine ligase
MGFALAAEAASRGAEVTLVAGPTPLATPLGVTRVDVTTAAQMAEAIIPRLEGLDAVIMAAAVADYRPLDPAETKIKKEASGESMTLELVRNEDILKALGQHERRPKVLVGFAAETGGDLDALARKKLKAKGCDLLVANDVSAADAGFEVETNRVVIHSLDAEPDRRPLMSKRGVAGCILDRVAQRLND